MRFLVLFTLSTAATHTHTDQRHTSDIKQDQIQHCSTYSVILHYIIFDRAIVLDITNVKMLFQMFVLP